MSRHSRTLSAPKGTIVGPLRMDPSARNLIRRLSPGDIAVVDVLDLDRSTAEALAKCRPAAVLNVRQSISGRYPAGGASVLVGAGIPLVDEVGSEILALREGITASVTLHSGADAGMGRDGIRDDSGAVDAREDDTKELEHAAAAASKSGKRKAPATKAKGAQKSNSLVVSTRSIRAVEISAGPLDLAGKLMDHQAIASALEEAHAGMKTQLAVFTANAMDAVEHSGSTLLEGANLPDLGLKVEGKHVMVIASGYGHEAQLRRLRHYVRDRKPVIIAVGTAADAARAAKIPAAVIVGELDSVGDAALAAAKHVVVHHAEGTKAAATRVDALRLDHSTSELAVSSEDLAILLARAGGAEVIVTVGVEATLLDFLESGRPETAGTFLTRLAAGSRLVDADTLAAVYRPKWSGVFLVAGLLIAVIALAAALWVNGDSRDWLEQLWSGA